jgi:prepilin-type processing-associated H-X9-DG protein
VVIAIIAILIALLLPAVQQAREAARRSQCKNNLKQFGLALHNYVDVHNAFPPGWIGVTNGGHNPSGSSGYAWGTFVLPYLEQSTLSSRLTFTRAMDDDSTSNRALLAQPLAVFQCPSDPKPDTYTATNRDGDEFEVATANYAGVFGSVELDECFSVSSGTYPLTTGGQCVSDGTFFHNSRVRLRDITDGTSNTLMVGERTTFHDGTETVYGTWAGALPEVDDSAAQVVGHAEHLPNMGHDPEDFGSAHVGGAQFVMADGHVVLISQNMDKNLFIGLGTRAGNEVLGEF